MTSTSYLGATSIVLQFDLDRNIDGAARDVQAAINAARGYLPSNLPANPNYRKVNPGDAPILIFALTSDTMSTGRLYDAASTILQQQLSRVDARWAVIEGDWGLARSIHVVPTVTYGPAAYERLPPVGHYYPSFGIQPGYGRRESNTQRRRPVRQAESYSRSWGTESAQTPASIDPPVNPPEIIYAPQQRDRRWR